MRRSPRSARWAIVATALILVALPLAMLLISSLYERVIHWRYQGTLQRIAEEIASDPRAPLHELGVRAGVEIVRLDSTGRQLASSETSAEAMARSTIGGWLETLLEDSESGPSAERGSFRQLHQAFGPLETRSEVREALGGRTAFATHDAPNGEALMFSATAPSPGGGAVVVMKTSVRGLRRLFSLRFELVKLMAAQVLFAALMIFLLSRWLVRPLEELADGVREFPAADGTLPTLARRTDEIGELARTIRTATQSLEERRRASADLAADLAHEFKNPLATIAASSELIATTRDPNPEKRELVHSHIQEAVARMRTTTDELLGLMRLDVALGEQPRETVDYREWLDGVVGRYRRDPQHAAFTFQLQAPESLPPVRVVASAWERMITNLLDNALVQPTADRRVVIGVRREGDSLITEVRDFGPGVSPGNRDKIFRRFFTQRPEGVAPGTGLGLSIVQTVAHSHGARVELDSPEGGGALFRVILPLPAGGPA